MYEMKEGDNNVDHVIREHFDSLGDLISVIEKRPNNRFMRNEHDSNSGSSDFTGTRNYEEAVSMLKNGYPDPIPEIKSELVKSRMATSKIYRNMPRPMPKNQVVGFIPNVPNALRGIPQSMISIEKENQKRKVISILYSFGSCGGTKQEELVKAGIALVAAINIIELSGIQTKLLLGFMPSKESSEIVFPTVKIKDFGERFNLQKICFPMIHPSMFRRIGFKYLETCPECEENFSFGYGRPVGMDTLKENIQEKDTYVITTDWIREHDFSVEEILKEMDVLH